MWGGAGGEGQVNHSLREGDRVPIQRGVGREEGEEERGEERGESRVEGGGGEERKRRDEMERGEERKEREREKERRRKGGREHVYVQRPRGKLRCTFSNVDYLFLTGLELSK